MIPARVTWEDASLAHQLILRVGKTSVSPLVSCNCLRTFSRHGVIGYRPMVDECSYDLKEIWEVYDNPDNHNHQREVFTPGYRSPKETYGV